jgi:hypothetical protein
MPNRQNLYITTGRSKKNFTKQKRPFGLTKSLKQKVHSLVKKLKINVKMHGEHNLKIVHLSDKTKIISFLLAIFKHGAENIFLLLS